MKKLLSILTLAALLVFGGINDLHAADVWLPGDYVEAASFCENEEILNKIIRLYQDNKTDEGNALFSGTIETGECITIAPMQMVLRLRERFTVFQITDIISASIWSVIYPGDADGDWIGYIMLEDKKMYKRKSNFNKA